MDKVEQIKKKICKNQGNISFDLSNWEKVISCSPFVPEYYVKSLVDYYATYLEGINLSFLIEENNTPIGLFPFIIHEKNEKFFLSVEGQSLLPPLFIDDIPKKLRKRVEKNIVDTILLVAEELKVEKIEFAEPNQFLTNWYLYWLERAEKDFATYQFAINLQKNIEDIRLDFRKSYKPLVNKGIKEWQVEVCNKDYDKTFEEFKYLHKEVAGKQTRSDETWKIQKEQIINHEAFLVTVRDHDLLIGAGFFNYSRDVGLYSVGAYKRELSDKPIGHVVQMTAIKKLKDLGCKTYHLGKKALNGSTEKELSISHFKEGFAGYVYAEPHIEVYLN